MKKGFVYIITNKNHTSFYIGVTHDIKRRILEHKTKENPGFSSKYNLCILVYYERIEGMDNAIAREKQLKNWHRAWKINLIKEFNPEMKDLSEEWYIKRDGRMTLKDWINVERDPETSSG